MFVCEVVAGSQVYEDIALWSVVMLLCSVYGCLLLCTKACLLICPAKTRISQQMLNDLEL